MKIPAKFYSKNNEIFLIDGDVRFDAARALPCTDSIPETKGALFAVHVEWSSVGKDEDSYNEGFLADLRDKLKKLEETGSWAFIVPEADGFSGSDTDKENLTASMKHCARRIKDCENVVGFAVPEECDSDFFMEELSAKHKQYIFFSKNEELLSKSENIARF